MKRQKMRLLTSGQDAKTVKGEKRGVVTSILYLAPHTLASQRYPKMRFGTAEPSGILRRLGVAGKSICPFSTPGCRDSCLYTAGRAQVFRSIPKARLRKTRWLLTEPAQFLGQLRKELHRLNAKAARDPAHIYAVRLNGTSDLRWWEVISPADFPLLTFYDYTKRPPDDPGIRAASDAGWHFTYSLSESSVSYQRAVAWQSVGVRSAVVFRKKPALRNGIVDGDADDTRFFDPPALNFSPRSALYQTLLDSSLVALKAKGRAKRDTTGFVMDE